MNEVKISRFVAKSHFNLFNAVIEKYKSFDSCPIDRSIDHPKFKLDELINVSQSNINTIAELFSEQ